MRTRGKTTYAAENEMNISIIKSASSLLDSLGVAAIVAGGAIRDAVLSKPVKDFDVYAQDTPEVREAMLRRFPNMAFIQSENGDQYPNDEDGFLQVFDAHEEHEGKAVQVMLLRNHEPAEYVADVFDFGLCKAYLCPTDGLVLLPEFIQDVRENTCTFYSSDLNWFSVQRADRMREKFPDYRIVRPW